MKVHWLAFDITTDMVRRAFAEFGDVKEVTVDRWRAEDGKNAESASGLGHLVLREGIVIYRVPHQLRIGSGTALVLVPAWALSALGVGIRDIFENTAEFQSARNATLSATTAHVHMAKQLAEVPNATKVNT